MYKSLCVGGCGRKAIYKGWCKINWFSGKKFGVGCPKITEKRSKAISAYRLEEALNGKNPMQNPEICKKNHTVIRNQKAAKTLRLLGKQGLLPQQIESLEAKTERRKKVSQSLYKLWLEGKHPRQLETFIERRTRLKKMADTLKKLGEQGKLPVQNLTPEQKKKLGQKISKSIREGIKNGRIKLSPPGWKRVKYKNFIFRSNWEKILARFLDKNHFKWEYETLKINYFDSENKVDRITIPDFYLPSNNIIIEVKGNFGFNSQITKDKSKAIIKEGFKFLLVGKKEIKMIEDNENFFLNNLNLIV